MNRAGDYEYTVTRDQRWVQELEELYPSTGSWVDRIFVELDRGLLYATDLMWRAPEARLGR